MGEQISLKQLRYLVAVADHLHFRRAAEAVGVTQPALSGQITELETRLRLRLIERGKGPVSLTPAGREIVARARRIADEVTGLVDAADGLRDGAAGALRLGSSLTVGPYLLPTVLRGLHRTHPDLALHIREGTPADLEAELLEGIHDAVLTQLPMASADLGSAAHFREPLSLVVPVAHPLAARDLLDRDDLAGEGILTLGPKYPLRAQVQAICRETGARLLDRYEGTSLDGLRQMVGLEMGVALMPALYVASEVDGRDPGVVSKRFRGCPYYRGIGLAWRRSSGRIAALEALGLAVAGAVAQDFAGVLRI